MGLLLILKKKRVISNTKLVFIKLKKKKRVIVNLRKVTSNEKDITS